MNDILASLAISAILLVFGVWGLLFWLARSDAERYGLTKHPRPNYRREMVGKKKAILWKLP
jgi:hypothetical protein